ENSPFPPPSPARTPVAGVWGSPPSQTPSLLATLLGLERGRRHVAARAVPHVGADRLEHPDLVDGRPAAPDLALERTADRVLVRRRRCGAVLHDGGRRARRRRGRRRRLCSG